MIVCSLCVLLCNVIYLNVAFFIKLTMAVTIFIVYNVIFHVGQSTILPQSYSEARYIYTLFLISQFSPYLISRNLYGVFHPFEKNNFEVLPPCIF